MQMDVAALAAAGTELYRALRLHAAGEMSRVSLDAGASIDSMAHAEESCFLIESGLVAKYVTVDVNRATCISLAGSGELLGLKRLFGPTGDGPTESRPVVPVTLLEIEAKWLCGVLTRSPILCNVCMRQQQMQLVSSQRIAACNARHVLPARCAHWLAQLQARLGDVLPVTHEFLASVLGVRRAGVTVTLQTLQTRGIIQQRRGSIVVTDVQRLRQAACSCPIQPDCATSPLLRPPMVDPSLSALAAHGVELSV